MYEGVHKLVRPSAFGVVALAATFCTSPAEAQDASPEKSPSVERTVDARLYAPVWQREVGATLLNEIAIANATRHPNTETCAEVVNGGAEACMHASDETALSSVTVLQEVFSNETRSAPLAIGGKVTSGEYGTNYSAVARIDIPGASSRVEVEYGNIPQREILGQTFGGGRWAGVRALVDTGEWKVFGNGRGERGSSVTLEYKKFQANAVPLEGDFSGTPLTSPDSRTFWAPTNGKKPSEGYGVTVTVKKSF